MHVVLIFLGTLASMKREVCCEGDWDLGVERGKKTSVRKFDEYGNMMTLIIVMAVGTSRILVAECLWVT